MDSPLLKRMKQSAEKHGIICMDLDSNGKFLAFDSPTTTGNIAIYERWFNGSESLILGGGDAEEALAFFRDIIPWVEWKKTKLGTAWITRGGAYRYCMIVNFTPFTWTINRKEGGASG